MFKMVKPSSGVRGPIRYLLPVPVVFLPVLLVFAIGLAIGKLAPEQAEISKAPALLSAASSPATARVDNAETTIVWGPGTGEPMERTDPGPPTSDIKPENTVSTSTPSQYEVALRPVETPAVIEPKLPLPSSQANGRVGERYGAAPLNTSSHAVIGFKAPSGNIRCQLPDLKDGDEGKPAPYLRCDILQIQGPLPPKPRNCDGNWGQAFTVLQDAHRAQRMCYDTEMDDHLPTLPYSSTWRRAGFSCISEPSGVTCTNRSGHGFHLSRTSQKLF
jgi:hypothetical protein